MNDKKIFKISLITLIIGLMGIILLSGYVNPEKLTIKQINKSKIDNQIELDANIESIIKTKSNTQIIKLKDQTGNINLIIFPSTNLKTKLIKNQKITVIGRVTQYNGELELILEESKNIKIG
ncbi:OB-fold nucleic acid binding domain-containing protein [Methanosphaera sp. ISO3-F5]|uniref:OB-fold nucleic acid binding domain-containing protein n=1 Tax=Methanosphaera sp. ISO3-F5 TaxID=1452353 RepID=UPI002B259DFC|nr:OB-fold nucleic acid binding domain-containing protein [Methanosphaera sp. ISO3-F5]WQH65154.1 OB-fold nucleic acid binding domain-containing protein [Methanosphaera sp. ISO3-F5]